MPKTAKYNKPPPKSKKGPDGFKQQKQRKRLDKKFPLLETIVYTSPTPKQVPVRSALHASALSKNLSSALE